MKSLDKLVPVSLRTTWPVEPDFTKWLALPENLEILGDEVGIDLELVKVEAEVINFRADILAKDRANNQNVIIENQFQGTNHDHLGKIITYAAGHDATSVIWIFEDIREEHRRAIDWLNENTVEELSFFAVELELWKIGNSEPAPRFNVVCRPNDWAKTTKQSSAEITPLKQKQFAFWSALREHSRVSQSSVRLRAPHFQHWTDISIGTSLAHIALTMNTQEKRIACEIYINAERELFKFLEEDKAAIEKELGATLEWRVADKASRIIEQRFGFDIDKEEGFTDAFDWLLSRATLFKKVFAGRVETYQEAP